MNTTQSTKSTSESTREPVSLDRRYGEIGISAVAAAVRYQSEPRQSDRSATIPHETD